MSNHRRYRRKPIETYGYRLCETDLFGIDNGNPPYSRFPPWVMALFDDGKVNSECDEQGYITGWTVDTGPGSGVVRADLGDWLLLDADGNPYPCVHRVFVKTHEEIDDAN